MNQVAILAGQGPQRRCIGIEERAQDCREGGLCRSLLARQHDNGIGTTIAQGGKRPGDHQHEVGVGLDVEERAQCVDRSAARRYGQALHTRRTPEPHRRMVDHSPAGGVDLHRAPSFVALVEVEPTVDPTHAI